MRLWSSGYDRGFPTAFVIINNSREIVSNPGSTPGSRIKLQVQFAPFSEYFYFALRRLQLVTAPLNRRGGCCCPVFNIPEVVSIFYRIFVMQSSKAYMKRFLRSNSSIDPGFYSKSQITSSILEYFLSDKFPRSTSA